MANLAPDRRIRVMQRNADWIERPILLYDGECGFCSLWVNRWRDNGTGNTDFFPSSSGIGARFGVSPDQDLDAVKLIEVDGNVRSGGAAVLRLMDLAGGLMGRMLWRSYGGSRLFRSLIEGGYRMIAGHRGFFSAWIRIPWGRDVRKPRGFLAAGECRAIRDPSRRGIPRARPRPHR